MGTACPQLESLVLSHNQLDANAISAVPSPLPGPEFRHARCCKYAAVGVLLLGFLKTLRLEHTVIDGPVLRCLAQGQWPVLESLSLQGNKI